MVGHRIMGNLAIEAMTLDEFIQWQSKQDVRHEYLDGEIVAMTGGSVAHDDVRNNVMAKLREHLRGSPCRAFGSDVALRPNSNTAWLYPDLFVTCRLESIGSVYVTSAKLILEVLSPRTQGRDRVEKLQQYQQIDELSEYVLVDPHLHRIEIYRREANGTWKGPKVSKPEMPVIFESLEFVTTYDVIFEHVAKDPDETN